MPTLNLPKKHYENTSKKSNKRNSDDHKWVYNTQRWRELRLIYLSEQPLCQECLKQNHLRSACEVHHCKPISQFKTKELKQFWGLNKENLKGLCTECHKAEHQFIRNTAKADELQRIKKLIAENRNNACI